MHYTKRLLILAICVISLGSAKESQYLAYAIESPDEIEFLDRQTNRNDKGFLIDTDIQAFHPSLNETTNLTGSTDFQTKGHRSYSRKSAYY